MGSRRLALLLLALALAVVGVLRLADARLVGSQNLTLVASFTRQSIPADDPWASVWQAASPVQVPLSAQTLTAPKGGGSVRNVTVRSLHNGERLYILAEWDDSTQDISSAGTAVFRDAVAVQFPSGGAATTPSFCMGQADVSVNIWHWKADWQADVDQRLVGQPASGGDAIADYYPLAEEETFYPARAAGNLLAEVERASPVENLLAGGFGTLTTPQDQPVGGQGRWQEGKWRVLFARPLEVKGDLNAQFQPDGSTNVAFAVWDGHSGERDGMKSVSQFLDLKLAAGMAPHEQNWLWLIVLGVAGGGAVLALALWQVVRRMRGQAGGPGGGGL